jgi:tetratricopeptide (TPR) repeat protein
MIRSTASAVLGSLLYGVAACIVVGLTLPDHAVPRIASVEPENGPICTSKGSMADGADWATLDPHFATGRKALAAADWSGAIAALAPAALRDARNADLQNHLGYAYRRLRQLDPAFQHYRQALALNPRHRGAHGHIGEAYLAIGNLAGAEHHLAALEEICLIPCEEYDALKAATAPYRGIASR